MKKNLVRIVEDEQEIADILKDILLANDFEVEVFLSAEDFYLKSDSGEHALYLIDWNLPGETGIDIIKKIRSSDKSSPIFIVSAYSSKENIVHGLQAGADDYIIKPFDYEELIARVQNAWSKFDIINNSSPLGRKGVSLLPDAHSFIKDGVTISLTSREYIIFDFLYSKLARPVSRDELIQKFSSEDMTARNIDVHIFSLRKKIKKCDMAVATVWGVGYKLVA